MSKIIKTIAAVILLTANLFITALAYNYTFSSGADTLTAFDKTTDKDDFYDDVNVRRNKDAAYSPPPYGVFSGDIATERTNPYYSPDNYSSSNTSANKRQFQQHGKRGL